MEKEKKALIELRDGRKNGLSEVVSLLLYYETIANANRKEMYGYTPLYIACYRGYIEVVSLLLNHGANVNQPKNTGTTPLYIACANGYVEIVSLLLKNGANVNQANNNGYTPLYIASAHGHVQVVSLLLKFNGKLLFIK